MTLKIGIVGDFNPQFHTHPAIERALWHAADRVAVGIEARWVPTPSVTRENAVEVLSSYDGVWLSPGSPYKSMEGALESVRFARERNWPFVGT